MESDSSVGISHQDLWKQSELGSEKLLIPVQSTVLVVGHAVHYCYKLALEFKHGDKPSYVTRSVDGLPNPKI